MTDRRRLAIVCVIGAALAAILVAVRAYRPFPVGNDAVGAIANTALAVQLAALVLGVAAIHMLGRERARTVLGVEGVVCALALGSIGVAYLAFVSAWYVASRALRGWPCVLAWAALLAALYASAWTRYHLAGLAFSMAFTPRLVMFAWDRWQQDFAPASLRDAAMYLLLPPLVVVPCFLAVVPFFDGFAAKVTTGMTARRARAIAVHLGWAAVFGGVRAALTLIPEQAGAIGIALRFLAVLAYFATIGHGLVAILLAHGIEERMPVVRPLLATSYVELWNRFMVHQKDMQVALFYTPALLHFRRRNRYLAIILAIAWTMIVGNLLLHACVGYAFYAARDGAAFLPRLGVAIAINAMIAAALAIQLCRDEWRRRHCTPPRVWWRAALGWAITMTIGALGS